MDQEWFTFETAGTLIVGWEGGPLHHKHASCHETSDKKKDSTKFSAISERDESSDSSDDEHHTIATGGKSLKKDYTDALDLAGYERPKTTATGIEIAAALATGNIIGPNKEFFQRKIVIIFIPINLNMCFGCSKEPSQ